MATEETKQYSFSKEEFANLKGRDAVASQHRFIVNLIERDMDLYVEEVVKKRLGLTSEDVVQYDLDKQTLVVLPKAPQEAKIVGADGEKLTNNEQPIIK